MQGHDDTSNFDDYSHLGPLNHPFPLTIRDQTAFQNF